MNNWLNNKYASVKKASQWIIIIILASSVFMSSTNFFTSENTPRTIGWGFFHYYLGAKYFDQVGYTKFYSCSTEASLETIGWNRESLARDLTTYKLSPIKNLAPCDKSKFSENLWNDYKKDVLMSFETDYVSTFDKKIQLITDKGFNATPFWIVTAKLLMNYLPLKLIVDLDIILIFLSIVAIYYFYGERQARITSLLVLLFFGTFFTLGGQFLQYTWFIFLTFSIIFWHQKKPILSGVLGGLSVGSFSFPIFFMIPMFISALKTPLNFKTNYAKFAISCMVTIFLCLVIGSGTEYKVGAWQKWYEKISIHSHYLKGEIFNMGLPVIATSIPQSEHGTSISYEDEYPRSEAQIVTYNKIKYYLWFISILIIVWWLYLVWNSNTDSLFGYGLIPMYILNSLSPYYYLSIALLPLMFLGTRQKLQEKITHFTLSYTVISLAINLYYGGINFNYYQNVLSGLALFIFMTAYFLTLYMNNKSIQE